MRDEKLHAILARSRFGSQKTKNTSCLEHFWAVEMWKKCTALWCEVRSAFRSQNAKKNTFRPLLEVEMSKKCTLLWREAHFEVNMLKNTAVSEYFWKSGAKSARCCGTKHIWKSNA